VSASVRWASFALAAPTLLGCASSSGTPHSSGPPASSPSPARGADVGPLFLGGVQLLHTCTASVVHSPAGNVIATAAHCVFGPGVGISFAPGYDKGRSPYGSWTVTGAYADAAWIAQRDPHADVAFLVVKPSLGSLHPAPVESVVGASALAVAPADGTQVTATGYALGSGDSALTCSAATTTTDGYPTLPCGPLPLGTSGGPWISTTANGPARLVGLIGGLHQGGCSDTVSYSAPFTTATATLLARAAAGAAGDTFPGPSGDGC